MASRSADAVWRGTLQEGEGSMKLGSGAYEGAYSFTSRFGEGAAPGTNPEELIAAAQAGCFTMALGAALGRAGYTVNEIKTHAELELRRVDEKLTITKAVLTTQGAVEGVDAATFQQFAEDAKKDCIVSRALAGITEMEVHATLL